MQRGRRPCGQLHSNHRIRCICTDQVQEARNFHDKEIQQPGRQMPKQPNIAPADQILETPIDALSFADDSMQSTVSAHVESLKPASQQIPQRDESKVSRLASVFYICPSAPFRVMKSMRPAGRWTSRGFAAEPSLLTVMYRHGWQLTLTMHIHEPTLLLARYPSGAATGIPRHQHRKERAKCGIVRKQKGRLHAMPTLGSSPARAIVHESLMNCVEGQKLCLHEEGSLGSRTRSVDV
jgi:hypothetical protein